MTDNLAIEPDLFYSETVKTADDLNQDEEQLERDSEHQEEDQQSQDDESNEQEDSGNLEESELYEIEGESFTLDDFKKYKQAYEDRKSMQADYTRKNQERARLVKEEARKLYEQDSGKMAELIANLEAQIETDDVDLDELKEYDEGEYYKQLHKRKLREEALEKAKAKLQDLGQAVNLQQEQQKLIEQNPHWVDSEGKATDEYTADMKLMNDFYKENDWTESDIKAVNTAKSYMLVLNHAKMAQELKALKEKQKSAAKKLKPKSVTQGKNSTARPKSLSDLFYN